MVTTKNTITIHEKISDNLQMLSSNKFIQVHKSFATPKKHIKSIEGNRIYINDYTIPIGKMYKVNVVNLLKSL